MLGRAADAIGEDDEAARCEQFLRDREVGLAILGRVGPA
jgi:hypothetical protein